VRQAHFRYDLRKSNINNINIKICNVLIEFVVTFAADVVFTDSLLNSLPSISASKRLFSFLFGMCVAVVVVFF